MLNFNTQQWPCQLLQGDWGTAFTLCAEPKFSMIPACLPACCNDLGKIMPNHWGQIVRPALQWAVEEWLSVRIWPPPAGLARSWGKQQSDSWSSMAPCLTPSTMCSPGQEQHFIPWRHVCHPEHLVGGSPPQSLGSSCACTGLEMVLNCVRVDFRVCDLLFIWHLSDPKGSESRGPADCLFALSLRSKPRGPVITKRLSWRP